MLFTLTTTHRPATDLGHLLRKNPARAQVFDASFGQVHVFYPEASDDRCTAAMLLEVDPVALVRNRHGPSGDGFALEQYVNDRPYAASSFLSVAISQVFGSALAGSSKERPELVAKPLPLIARLAVVPCRGSEEVLRRLFEPLGYRVAVTSHPLDERFPEWGSGRYFTLELTADVTVHDLLSHLYVLIPVLDGEKHYWIGDDEVDKLLRHGQGWLPLHPEREQIVRRYLPHRRHLIDEALARLEEVDPERVEQTAVRHADEEEQVEKPISLNEHRLSTVTEILLAAGAKRVLDLGCSYGNLLRRLKDEKQFERIVGLDVSHRALEIAADRIKLSRLPERQRERLQLLHGSLTYRDERLKGFDAAAVVEVIEHLDESRLAAFARVLFEFTRPPTVVITTPNAEYNVRFPSLPAGKFRHRDHRFEWTRPQFHGWCEQAAHRFGYSVRYVPVGPEDPEVGPATQAAVFSLGGQAGEVAS